MQIPKEMIHYGVTKTMQVALARGLAELTSGTNVTVNSVLPGPTRSEGVEVFVKNVAKEQGKSAAEVEKEFFQTMRPSSLIQRFATNEEVANLVAYVASPLLLGHERRGPPRRWRRREIDSLSRISPIGPIGPIGPISPISRHAAS